jgi:hypothetical protein
MAAVLGAGKSGASPMGSSPSVPANSAFNQQRELKVGGSPEGHDSQEQ